MTDTKCEPCLHAAAHSWWGPSLAPAKSHCSDCHKSWASLNEGHCSMCCAHFTNTKAFDAHLLEEGCQAPGSIMRRDGQPKFIIRERSFGPVWALADYRDKNRRPFVEAASAS